jgi:molecular chaperone DnaK
MTYQLGVDLGTTKIAAAVWDGQQVRPVQLGNRSTAVPSVVFLRDDGSLMFGEAAQRRADGEPNRAAREFKRRVGDPVPLWLAGASFSAQRLMALMLTWVIDRVAELEGERPTTVVVTHPANWGPYKRESFLGAVQDAGVESARLLPEPIAAALHFDSVRRVRPGATMAIYDLGGGTFDAAVVRRAASSFEILGAPGGIDTVGGMEFDEAVLGQVWAALGGAPAATDPTRMAALRREIVEAKEYLSEDVSADIHVDLAEERRTVVIRRSELEELIRPLIDLTIESLERSVHRSGAITADLTAVVLVGGSSRVPLVQELLGARLGRLVILDNQPQLAIALGAALSPAPPVEVPRVEVPWVAGASPVGPAPSVGVAPSRRGEPVGAAPVGAGPAREVPSGDPPTEKLEPVDPQTELLESFDALVFAQRPVTNPAAEPAAEPTDGLAGSATEVDAGPDDSFRGWFGDLSPLGLVLLLIGAALAVIALISGINAALSVPGRGGAEPGGAPVPPGASAVGAPLPVATTWPWRLPTATSTKPARAPTSRAAIAPTAGPTRFPRVRSTQIAPVPTARRSTGTRPSLDPTQTAPEPSNPEPSSTATESPDQGDG